MDDDEPTPPVPVEAHTAWHASPQAKVYLAPMDHVGTRRAAIERGLSYGKPFFLHEVRIAGGPALVIRDSVGSTHRLGGMIEELERDLGLPFSFADDLLTRNRGGDPGVAAELAGAALGRGYALLTYCNAVEDPGSASCVVLAPASAPVVSGKPFSPAEAAEELELEVQTPAPCGP